MYVTSSLTPSSFPEMEKERFPIEKNSLADKQTEPVHFHENICEMTMQGFPIEVWALMVKELSLESFGRLSQTCICINACMMELLFSNNHISKISQHPDSAFTLSKMLKLVESHGQQMKALDFNIFMASPFSPPSKRLILKQKHLPEDSLSASHENPAKATSSNVQLCDDEIIQIVRHCPNMTSFSKQSTLPTSIAVLQELASGAYKELKTIVLDINHPQTNDVDIVFSNLPSLEFLHLGCIGKAINEKEILCLNEMNSLTSVYLHFSRMPSLEELEKLSTLRKLHRLSFYFTNHFSEELIALLKSMPALEQLDLPTHCALSPEIQDLKKSLPHLAITAKSNSFDKLNLPKSIRRI